MDKKPLAVHFLRVLGVLLPGNYLKTFFYLNFIAKPRRVIRRGLNGFYRMEHVYDVLMEMKGKYKGEFSILEFGTHQGYSFTKMLYATRYTGMSGRVTVHAFDTFEGMPAPSSSADLNVIDPGDNWREGQFAGAHHELSKYCQQRYSNWAIHPGLFNEALTGELLDNFREQKPILVWFDCDFYSSTRSAFERLLPVLPSGCVVYFDEYEWNYGSRFSGESRFVHEVNAGIFGDDIELILDENLSYDSKRVYRFVRASDGPHYELATPPVPNVGRHRTNDSALP
jgi:hypothetical protein